MAHFACLSPPFIGHINPMAALARELERRGHRTTFLHMPDVAPIIARQGLAFEAVGEAAFPKGTLAAALGHAALPRSYLSLFDLVRDFAAQTAMLCETLPQALRALGVDMILSDQMESAGGLVAYHLGLPFVSLAAALPSNWDHSVPSAWVDWAYGETKWHRWRNGASNTGANWVMRPIGDVIQRYVAQWGLQPLRHLSDCWSGFAQIAQLTPSLDYPRKMLTGCFHYCGPLRDRAPDLAAPAPRVDRARAFSSLGSLQGHRMKLFEQIAGAAAANDLDLTIAHGGGLSEAQAARLSRRATVHAFVKQDDVLRECEIAILHGGMNTVLDALARGVPIVVVPVAFEQGAIANRVERAGAGLVCRSRVLRRPRIAALIRQVLEEPRYARAAAGLSAEIRAAGGSVRAADIVEHVLTTGQPCLNAETLAAA